jgi:mono/diheme cytochrome c family protein
MRIFRVVLLACVGVLAAFVFVTRPHLPAAERGRRLAEQQGCFGCHGAAGTKGAMNPGRSDKSVPTFAGDLMMYADDAADVRAWILDGGTARKRASKSWQEARAAGAVHMPAFRGLLAPERIEELVAYVMLVSGSPEPEDSLAALGLERAQALGCTGCHGIGGRLARPNPGSFKGCVPSWDGADLPELVANEAEFAQWVRHGVSARFKANPIAMFFLKRGSLHMPAYEEHLAAGDLAALWAYVRWLRSPAADPDSARVTSF